MDKILTLGIETGCDGKCAPVSICAAAVLCGGQYSASEVHSWIKF